VEMPSCKLSQRLLHRQWILTSGSTLKYWLYMNGVGHDVFRLLMLETVTAGDSDSSNIPLPSICGHCTTSKLLECPGIIVEWKQTKRGNCFAWETHHSTCHDKMELDEACKDAKFCWVFPLGECDNQSLSYPVTYGNMTVNHFHQQNLDIIKL